MSPRSAFRRSFGSILTAVMLGAVLVAQPGSATAVSSSIVISQVYGGGGNTGAPYQNDFIELFNLGSSSVSLAGWSLQYASATGTGNFGATSTQITPLPSVTLAPGQYLLAQEASNAAVGAPLPTADVVDATPIAMGATGGKVALVNTTTPLGCNGGTTPCSAAALATVVDLVGYGADFYEGSAAAPSLTNTTAALRGANGCTETDDNAADFTAGTPSPRNTTSPLNVCVPALTFIRDIQGAGHLSPKVGQTVSNVPGIVTALRTNGFYLQDPSPDADEATSEGIFVFTSSSPTVAVGDSVRAGGTVTEFRPGGASSANLTTTELTAPTIAILSSGNALPPPIVVGTGGRIPPATVIEDDATGDVETSGSFDPASDGIDFSESLEGMRVQLNDAVAVGPSTDFGEIPVLGDDGANASVRTPRGGIVVRENDFNPERVILDDAIAPTPSSVNVGDHLSSPIVGVMDYSFGTFKLLVTSTPTVVPGGLLPGSVTPAGAGEVSIATFSMTNLDPGDPASRFADLAEQIVDGLGSPDILVVQGIQDSNGPTNDSVVDADDTYAELIASIEDAGGPTYDVRQIDPVDDQDGGIPGGNIRVAFLLRTDRGLSFVDRAGGTSTSATGVTGTGASTQLTFSPGRIDPTNAAFSGNRKPLAGEFLFHGRRLFVIATHLVSAAGDAPLFGRAQPPTLPSEVQRGEQAQIVNDFVDDILAADPDANVVVAGVMNDHAFSSSMDVLQGGSTPVLHGLIETLPEGERYSYVFEGNSMALDHILVSDALFARPYVFDVVHVNAEFAVQASDHDPEVVRIALNEPPTVDAGGPYTVLLDGTVVVTATGNDPEAGPLTYAWDLDDDGSFETPGQSATFAGTSPGFQTIGVQVTDDEGLTAVDTATVQVLYDFSGFLPPVDPLPTLNRAKAGSAIPVKFSLEGDQGLAIFASGYPRSEQIVCGSSAGIDGIEETVTAGGSSLSYDPATDGYVYVWKTNRTWANTCRQLVLRLIDGATYRANFTFTR